MSDRAGADMGFPTLETGIEGNVLALTDELADAIARVERREERMVERERRLGQEDAGALETALRRLVVGGVPGVAELAELPDVGPAEFFRRCLSFDGGYVQQVMCKYVREAARAYANPATALPKRPDDLLRLWEAANEGEPDTKVDVSHAALRQDPLLIGTKRIPTCAPERIAEQLERILALFGDERLPGLARSTAGTYLLWRTHPFRDGNGHLGRMIMRTGLIGSSRLTQIACARLEGHQKLMLSRWCCECMDGEISLARFSLNVIGIVEEAQAMAERRLLC